MNYKLYTPENKIPLQFLKDSHLQVSDHKKNKNLKACVCVCVCVSTLRVSVHGLGSYTTVLKVCRIMLVWWVSRLALTNTFIALETNEIRDTEINHSAKKRSRGNNIRIDRAKRFDPTAMGERQSCEDTKSEPGIHRRRVKGIIQRGRHLTAV